MKTNNRISTASEIIVDVRSKEEWLHDGHLACSVNYPLDQLDNKIEELRSYEKIILVCRSGARAAMARTKLLNAGLKSKIDNLGPWQNATCPK